MDKSLGLCALALSGIAAVSVAATPDPDASHGMHGNFGEVAFETSCTAEAQRQFNRALAMVHSFAFPETVKGVQRGSRRGSFMRDRLLGDSTQPASQSVGRAVGRGYFATWA